MKVLKIKFLAGIALVGCIVLSTVAFATQNYSFSKISSMGKEKNIYLRGELSEKRTRSTETMSVLEASISGSQVKIRFLAAVGNITVSVYSEEGDVVYSNSLYVTSPFVFFVPMSSLPHGIYSLEIASHEGQLEGEFYY